MLEVLVLVVWGDCDCGGDDGGLVVLVVVVIAEERTRGRRRLKLLRRVEAGRVLRDRDASVIMLQKGELGGEGRGENWAMNKKKGW